jgi:hypothetical protein
VDGRRLGQWEEHGYDIISRDARGYSTRRIGEHQTMLVGQFLPPTRHPTQPAHATLAHGRLSGVRFSTKTMMMGETDSAYRPLSWERLRHRPRGQLTVSCFEETQWIIECERCRASARQGVANIEFLRRAGMNVVTGKLFPWIL